MKKAVLFLSLMLFTITGYAQHVFTNSKLNLRSEATTDSRVVYQIPKGTAIDLNGCEDEWCEVKIGGYSGFIARQFTVSEDNYHSKEYKQSAHPIGPVKHYINSKGNVVQSPTHYNAPPAGATAQCRDGTYSFSQSRRGTCSHHGGVARWLQ